MVPYLGQIEAFGFSFAPKGWALCDGQVLPINQYESLYSLLGVMYGGDGRTTFRLPDLRGRASMHFGDGNSVGLVGGQETHTLTVAELAAHKHYPIGSNEDAKSTSPKTAYLGKAEGSHVYNKEPNTPMNANMIGETGGGQRHNNMQPYLVTSWCISLTGLFPPRN